MPWLRIHTQQTGDSCLHASRANTQVCAQISEENIKQLEKERREGHDVADEVGKEPLAVKQKGRAYVTVLVNYLLTWTPARPACQTKSTAKEMNKVHHRNR